MKRARIVALLSVFSWVLASACVDESPLLPVRSTCALTSECTSPLICAFQKCHVECKSSKDCAAGERCVQSSKPYFVCQLAEERQCSRDGACAGSQVCGPDGQCRDGCKSAKDCPKDQVCTSSVCADVRELADGGLPASNNADGGAFAHCNYASECPGDLICRLGTCTEECIADKDCEVGRYCGTRTAGSARRCIPGLRPDGGS